MSIHIIWKKPDNTVIIECLSPEHTQEMAQALVTARIAAGVYVQSQFGSIVTSEALPQDRYFRDAWRWNGTTINLDLPACRQRHLNKLRRIRDAKLTLSDSILLRALESSDTAILNEIKTIRQALRDMPQNIQTSLSFANTPEEIKSIRPAILDQNI